jgi:hypothetical protein
MELPPPIEAPQPDLPEENLRQPVEQGGKPAAQERAPGGPSAPGAAMPVAIPLPTPPQMPVQSASNQAVPATASLPTSQDSDLIEKEWVNKAKQIVERTRDDPYKQSEELTLVKADYLKKRYNKTIKIK